MALDGLFLKSVEKNLQDLMLECRIDKISQPEKDEIILSFNKNRKNYKLLISANPTYGRIHITNINKENPLKPPIFCMVLRKYLTSARVLSIEQSGLDRILTIKFESTDDLGFNSTYSLIVEIMNRHSNITLVRDRDNLIMDCIKHIGAEVNTYRTLSTGFKYVSPPKSEKFNLLKYDFDNFNDDFKNVSIDTNIFSSYFEGFSKKTSLSLYNAMLNANNDNIDLHCLKDTLYKLKDTIHTNSFNFSIYYVKKQIIDFHCIPLHIKDITCQKSFDNSFELLDAFYFAKDNHDRLNSKSSDLQRLINNNIDRCKKKLDIFSATLKQCETKDIYRLKGELLTANIYTFEKGLDFVELQNYYDETLPLIKITLDKNKTPSQNIQKYYKKYNKMKKSEEMSIVNAKLCEEELEYLYSVLNNILQVESPLEIEDIRNELIESGYIKFSKKKNKSKKSSRPYHFVCNDGSNIYVGKNNIQNDYLTLKFAKKNDIWLHTKNIPGSHVIIQSNNGEISPDVLNKAANLAAFYSKGRDSSKVDVDYTEVKNVKKPSGAKPGMVIYYTNKTIIATPTDPIDMGFEIS